MRQMLDSLVVLLLFTAVVLFAWNFFYKRIQAEMRRKKATSAFNAFKQDIKILRDDLQRLNDNPASPLYLLVGFFNSVSIYHDKDLTDLMTAIREANVDRKYDDVFNHLTALQLHFRKAGRDEYGWNRTKKGETVTAEKVFLGNVSGLFTHPIPFWEKVKNESRESSDGMNAYDVVCRQARQFMQSHTKPMINLIDSLRKAEV